MDARTELIDWLNRHEMNTRSNTQDYILAEYIIDCIRAYDKAAVKRDETKSSESSAPQTPQIEDPFGVGMLPPVSNSIQNKPIPAEVGNKVTTGWSNPFGGTSWGA